MARFVDAANLLSLVGLAAALACALLSAHGLLPLALIALIGSGLCDLFDGLIARRLARDDAARAFGARLDSLADACSFGLAPTVLGHAAGMRSASEIAILVLFACAAVWRLAYFDTVGMEDRGDARYYTGLPTTYVALVLPFAFLSMKLGPTALRVAADASYAALAVAMVSPIPVRKPGGAWYGVLLALAIALVTVYAVGLPSSP